MASGQNVIVPLPESVPLPRPRPTPPCERSTQVPLENGESEKCVVMPSIHNWVEQVYAAFEQTFPTGANEVVLLGVREMSRTAGETRADDDYTRDTRSAERGPLHADDGGDDTTTWNDLLFAVWTETTPEEGTKARIYSCTIDPAMDETGTTGTPYVLEGKAYSVDPGDHNGHDALHLYNDTPGFIVVAREATKSVRIFQQIESALVEPHAKNGTKRWEFVALHDNDTFHMHYGFNYASIDHRVENWSSGCTVLLHKRSSEVYKAFIDLTHNAANSSEIPYLVVSSAYVKAPDVWIAEAADDPSMLEDPASILRASGLVSAPAPLTGYLPSFMTAEFARQVLKLANDVDTVSMGVGGEDIPGLDESLASVLDLQREGDVLPDSVSRGLPVWSEARKGGHGFSDQDRASLLDGLSGLSEHLRSSLERACFQTVPPA